MEDIGVSIICTAYNHEKYIKQAIESFLMQKTSFRFEILIHDDASQDKTSDIIKEYADMYPDMIRAVLQTENQFSQGISPTVLLRKMVRGKYIAFCEGDDFWTDSNKLQKQYDFLENNSDYIACGHAASYCTESGEILTDKKFDIFPESMDITTEQALTKWCFATNSVFYRSSIMEKMVDYDVPFRKDCINGDYALTVFLTLNGKVFYSKDEMSVYRLFSDSSLNRSFRKDNEKYKNMRMKFLQMLHRINEYTEYRYDTVLSEYIRQTEFEIHLYVMCDVKKAKTYKDLYKKVPLKAKIKYSFKFYFPWAYELLRKMYRRFAS